MKTEKGTTEVDWAKELGIDLKGLREESFDHPRNFLEHREQSRKAAAYWEWKGSNNVRN
jgi:hypothetical protein